MRLSEILSRNNDLVQVVRTLKRDCAPYIEVLKQTSGTPLYRGSATGRPEPGNIKTIVPRLDRKPLDTPMDIHNFMNRRFEDKFHFPYRSGIYTTSDIQAAKHYGPVCVVFPIGELKYVWSPKVNDLVYVVHYIYDHEDFDDTDTISQNPQLAHEFTQLIDTYKTTDLADAIRMKNEVIFSNNCYTLTPNDYDLIAQELLR